MKADTKRAAASRLLATVLLAGLLLAPAAGTVGAQEPVGDAPPFNEKIEIIGPSAPSEGEKQPAAGPAAADALAPEAGIEAVTNPNYVWSQSTTTYTPITGGTYGTGAFDDQMYSGYPIGFPFTYNGVAYTTFSFCSNGYIVLGNAGATSCTSYTPISGTTFNNVIAAVGMDLVGNATTGEIRWQTQGTEPNRTFTVQWTDFYRYNYQVNDLMDFQITLYESSLNVEVKYGTFTVSGTNNTTAQVGLRGASSADYNNRTTTTNWASTTAGGFNTATMTLSTTVKPASGLTYTWTPAAPTTCATLSTPADAATGLSTTPSLIWTAPGSGSRPGSYDVYLDTVNPPATLAANVKVGPYIPGNLNYGTTYYWRIAPKNGGGSLTTCTVRSFTTRAQPAAGVAGTPVQVYYVPLPEQQTHDFMSLVSLSGQLGSTQRSIVSIVASEAGAVIYYDQWEDGYEATLPPPSPKQASTQIWGNGLASDGCPPNKNGTTLTCSDAKDLINAGDVIALVNDVSLPRVPTNLLYDGRDKFASTKAVAVTRAQWDTTLGTVLGSAVDVYDTSAYGTTFIVPAGENLPTTDGTSPYAYDYDAFSTTRLFVMAWKDNTSCTLTGQTAFALNEGEGYFAPAGVWSGDTLACDKPVQADLAGGNYARASAGNGWENRYFPLVPTDLWSTGYYTPVGAAGTTNYPSLVFAYNNTGSAITVNWARSGGTTGSFSVPANSVYTYELSVDSGHYFYSTTPFFAIQAIDLPNSANSQAFDWGITLIPSNVASDEVLVGWGPGNSEIYPNAPGWSTGWVNGSPLWVTPVDSGTTTIYVDYDGDPTTGPLTDGNGNKYDVSYSAAQYVSQRIGDTDDYNQTRMHIYTISGNRIVAAWGENATVAGASNPYLDLGTTIRPLPRLLSGKSAELYTDNDNDDQPSLGDVLRYIITIENRGSASVSNLNLVDTLPAAVSYNSNSTQVSYDNGATWPTSVANSGSTQFPLDEGGYNFPLASNGSGSQPGVLPGKATYQVRFLVTVTSTLDPALIDVRNTATWSWTGGNLYPEVTTPLNVMDWGDLPDGVIGGVTYGFPTLLANNGPRHTNSGLHLGVSTDADRFDRETNGFGGTANPTVGADGDDTTQVDDENGVAWPAYNSLRVNVTGGDGCLNAWMDFTNDTGSGVGTTHRDFNFTKTGGFDAYISGGTTYSEWIIQDRPVTAGENVISLTLPDGILAGGTTEYREYYFRFRLSPRNGSNGCTAGAVTDRGLVLGGEVEDYKKSFSPTAILLASMTATGQEAAIEVTWDTVSEVANAGFNLYRDISDAGPGVKLNEDLIPSQGSGSPEGYHYVYLDSADLAPNTTYWYWLEDVSTSGVATRHEPISVLYEGEPTAVTLAAFGGATAAGPALIGLAALAVLALAGVARRR